LAPLLSYGRFYIFYTGAKSLLRFSPYLRLYTV
jgi:hypothetical protein